jgi:hypothetical protein
LEREWEVAGTLSQKSLIASLGAFVHITFCGSFRRLEGFLVDLFGLIKYAKEKPMYEGKKHVMVPLLGRFKNKVREHCH